MVLYSGVDVHMEIPEYLVNDDAGVLSQASLDKAEEYKG